MGRTMEAAIYGSTSERERDPELALEDQTIDVPPMSNERNYQ